MVDVQGGKVGGKKGKNGWFSLFCSDGMFFFCRKAFVFAVHKRF